MNTLSYMVDGVINMKLEGNKRLLQVSKMRGSSYFKNEIPNEVEMRLNYLATYKGGEVHFFPNALRDCEDKYFRTQYGMRGIQDEVVLKPSDFDISVHREISR